MTAPDAREGQTPTDEAYRLTDWAVLMMAAEAIQKSGSHSALPPRLIEIGDRLRALPPSSSPEQGMTPSDGMEEALLMLAAEAVGKHPNADADYYQQMAKELRELAQRFASQRFASQRFASQGVATATTVTADYLREDLEPMVAELEATTAALRKRIGVNVPTGQRCSSELHRRAIVAFAGDDPEIRRSFLDDLASVGGLSSSGGGNATIRLAYETLAHLRAGMQADAQKPAPSPEAAPRKHLT